MNQESKIKTSKNALPAYERLVERIRRMISAKRLKPGEFVGTEADFSRTYGLARMTVRRAVETLIAAGILERRPGRGIFVRDYAAQTREVVFVAGNLSWTPSVRMLHGMMEVASDSGANVRIVDSHGDMELALNTIAGLPDSGACGAVIISLHTPEFNAALCALVARGFQFVVVDQRLAEIGAPSVVSDNFSGGEIAARAALEAGHRSIAFIGDLDATTTQERLAGVNAAVAEAGAEPAAAYNIDIRSHFVDWSENVTSATLRMLDDAPRATAILCSCDAVARSVVRTLKTRGIAVPAEMSVVGFDDDPIAEWMEPPLSTVRQDFAEMGRAAMRALDARLTNPRAGAESVLVPVAYVKRGSVAEPLRKHV